LPIPRSV
jgi:4-aminobutyrate aminotransferase-like enzyme